jgi:ribonuclease HI
MLQTEILMKIEFSHLKSFYKTMKKEIIIYTDGSSLGNPGEGGWGGVILVKDKVMEIGGYQKDATNNQMELEAILKSFEKLVEKNISSYSVEIFSDSKYCIQGITE